MLAAASCSILGYSLKPARPAVAPHAAARPAVVMVGTEVDRSPKTSGENVAQTEDTSREKVNLAVRVRLMMSL